MTSRRPTVTRQLESASPAVRPADSVRWPGPAGPAGRRAAVMKPGSPPRPGTVRLAANPRPRPGQPQAAVESARAARLSHGRWRPGPTAAQCSAGRGESRRGGRPLERLGLVLVASSNSDFVHCTSIRSFFRIHALTFRSGHRFDHSSAPIRSCFTSRSAFTGPLKLRTLFLKGNRQGCER